MSSIPFDLTTIKAFVLDMDGVVSATVSPVDASGMPMRTVNVKDGYAMQFAVKRGYIIAIISGGSSDAMRLRFAQLGVQHVYMKVKDKLSALSALEEATGLSRTEMLYVGDDMPDIPIMQAVALSCAPADAVPEVKEVATYISPREGGYGVVRDVIEQTLRSASLWSAGEGFGW